VRNLAPLDPPMLKWRNGFEWIASPFSW
jgi:hypothetical protein